MTPALSSVEWFLTVKGAVGVVAVCALVAHMWMERDHALSFGRTMRYLALLTAAVALTYASIEQLNDPNFVITSRNGAGLIAGVMILVASVASLVESCIERRQDRHRES